MDGIGNTLELRYIGLYQILYRPFSSYYLGARILDYLTIVEIVDQLWLYFKLQPYWAFCFQNMLPSSYFMVIWFQRNRLARYEVTFRIGVAWNVKYVMVCMLSLACLNLIIRFVFTSSWFFYTLLDMPNRTRTCNALQIRWRLLHILCWMLLWSYIYLDVISNKCSAQVTIHCKVRTRRHKLFDRQNFTIQKIANSERVFCNA